MKSLFTSTVFSLATFQCFARAFSSSSPATGSAGSAVKSTAIVKNLSVPGLKNGMDYVRLGDSDLVVSKVCMGTMTFGKQNTLEEVRRARPTASSSYIPPFLHRKRNSHTVSNRESIYLIVVSTSMESTF